MNYIVFDLEWNQSTHPSRENEFLPFEIIEIGAVKLNAKLQIIDEYDSLVKPQVYPRLQRHIRELVQYSDKQLKAGRPFDVVCAEFLKWCGEEEYTFCTWGSLDLYYLQQNMDFYVMDALPTPLFYLNLQEMFADGHEDLGGCKLERAVTLYNLPIDRQFHNAVNDAYYSGLVFEKMRIHNPETRLSVDYYNNPQDKESEIHYKHKFYSEYVTREFPDKTDAMADPELIELHCSKCGRTLHKKIKWFSNNSNSYLCVGRCWQHGYVLGRIKFKNTFGDNVFAIKRTHLIRKAEVEEVKQRQIAIREKRKERAKQQRLRAQQNDPA